MPLLVRPRLLLIDELSSGLAPSVAGLLLEAVREANAAGVTIVLVEQSLDFALLLADRAVFLEKGEVRFRARTMELVERPDLVRSVFLDGARAGAVHGGAVRAPRPDRLLEQTAIGPPALSVRHLSVSFGGIQAVDGIDLDVRAASIMGVIGPNGAG